MGRQGRTYHRAKRATDAQLDTAEALDLTWASGWPQPARGVLYWQGTGTGGKPVILEVHADGSIGTPLRGHLTNTQMERYYTLWDRRQQAESHHDH